MTTNMVHFSRFSRILGRNSAACASGSFKSETSTADVSRVTCVQCLKVLLREAPAGTALAGYYARQIYNLKVAQ